MLDLIATSAMSCCGVNPDNAVTPSGEALASGPDNASDAWPAPSPAWRFNKPLSGLTPQQLIAEVADEIEHLAGRPTSSERCIAALDRYLDEMSESNFAALHGCVSRVPEHQRIYLLGDMDARDMPLRTLLTPVAVSLRGDTHPQRRNCTSSDHKAALRYFRQRRKEKRRRETTPPLWEDDSHHTSPSVVRFDTHSGAILLVNEYPAPILIDGQIYPTVEHAYWVLATSDPDTRERVTNAPTAREACNLGQAAQLRSDWNVVRLAVMARLVRENSASIPILPPTHRYRRWSLINGVDISGSRYWATLGEGRTGWTHTRACACGTGGKRFWHPSSTK